MARRKFDLNGRAWAPRLVGGALALRGIIQPLTEMRAMPRFRTEGWT